MKSRDFCYWLQGYFEIGSLAKGGTEPRSVPALCSAQATTIRKHAELVFKHEGETKVWPFVSWVHGYIAGGIHAGGVDSTPIYERLQKVFYHEIDPTFPADQIAELAETHGKSSLLPPEDLLIGC